MGWGVTLSIAFKESISDKERRDLTVGVQACHRSRFFVIAITIPINSENLDRDPDLDTKKIL
jgi:hypothetical protein